MHLDYKCKPPCLALITTFQFYDFVYVFVLCIYTSMCMWSCVRMVTCREYLKVRGQPWLSFLRQCLPFVWNNFSLAWNLLRRPGWLLSGPRTLAVYAHGTDVTRFYTQVLGNKSLRLRAKLFTYWAVFILPLMLLPCKFILLLINCKTSIFNSLVLVYLHKKSSSIYNRLTIPSIFLLEDIASWLI